MLPLERNGAQEMHQLAPVSTDIYYKDNNLRLRSATV